MSTLRRTKRKSPIGTLTSYCHKRIAMNVVGFILVVSDYATRNPEAFPLRNVTASKVAEVLVELFSRHGIPEEILTDRGTNYTSSLLGELYRLIGVRSLRTSPYHPETDSLFERFNRTLKAMLKKTLTGEKWGWDDMLPYVLFAYREVPQAILGFSPFELLYGRDVRGPMEILKEQWVQDPEMDKDILTCVMDVRDRLQTARGIVEENTLVTQAKQKEYYDKKARELNLQQGNQVLLLLPSSTHTFQAHWQGPYTVVRRLGKVNYMR